MPRKYAVKLIQNVYFLSAMSGRRKTMKWKIKKLHGVRRARPNELSGFAVSDGHIAKPARFLIFFYDVSHLRAWHSARRLVTKVARGSDV